MARDQEGQAIGSGEAVRTRQGAILGPFVIFSAWTLWPALTPVHIEGFSAELQSMAIMVNRHGFHGLAMADQAYPISPEFLFLTRSGLVLLLQVFLKVFGEGGDVAFRLLTMASMATFVVSTFCVARRWSQDSSRLLFVALLLTPGLVEIGFYFSDNLPSAALALLGLAIVPRVGVAPLKGGLVWMAVGALFAAAILTRSDAVLIAPALIACLFLDKPKPVEWALRTAGGAVGFGVLFGLACALTPFHLSEAIPIIKLFGRMQAIGLGADQLRDVRVAFFGILTPILILIGIMINWRRSDYRWILGLIVLPGLFYIAVLPRAYEPRYYLLLGAPAILIHSAAGLKWLMDHWNRDRKEVASTIVRPLSISLALFVAFGPVDINFLDGPRTAYGRFWTTFIWRDWQSGVNNGLDKLSAVAASVQPGETVLAISSHYNADDYFRVRMLVDGYDILPAERAQAEYPGASEVFCKGTCIVAHVRCPDPYFYMGYQYGQPLYYSMDSQIMWGLSGLERAHFDRAVLLNWQTVYPIFDPALNETGIKRPDWSLRFPSESFIPRKAPSYYGDVFVQPVTFEQVEQIRLRAESEVLEARKRARGWKPILTYSEFHRKMGWRFGPAP
ncbi:MAG: glycosyltransferase family 39 protein [Fimbriimonas sp.]|nr:glycosyltransferase family 39 protein [Fimbriimonas sp.]